MGSGAKDRPETTSTDPAWRGVSRAGGLSFISAGILLVIVILTFPPFGPTPSTEAYLADPITRGLQHRLNLALAALVSILFVLGFLSLYVTLKDANGTYALLATGLAGIATPIAMIDHITFMALTRLSEAYVAASTPSERAPIVAAADFGLAFGPVVFVVGFVLTVVSILIISIVMVGGFSKLTGYLGITLGIAGLLGQLGPIFAPFFIFLFGSLLLWPVWLILAGLRLYRAPLPPGQHAAPYEQ